MGCTGRLKKKKIIGLRVKLLGRKDSKYEFPKGFVRDHF
jgi:hypothetical protein